jgi:hypothetical protein
MDNTWMRVRKSITRPRLRTDETDAPADDDVVFRTVMAQLGPAIQVKKAKEAASEKNAADHDALVGKASWVTIGREVERPPFRYPRKITVTL